MRRQCSAAWDGLNPWQRSVGSDENKFALRISGGFDELAQVLWTVGGKGGV